MSRASLLADRLTERYAGQFSDCLLEFNQVTVELETSQLVAFCQQVIHEPTLQFNQLIDVCGVDYLDYGVSQWPTEKTTETGFSRGVTAAFTDRESSAQPDHDGPRYAVVYHLLSTVTNQRLRLRVFLDESDLRVPSVVELWPAANWFEREAFDLYGILFEGHPDLRRILTDYGFIGHPFRKDFPISGHVEVRYDAKRKRVVYEPVDIEPRTGVAKVIRDDNRYFSNKEGA